MKKLMLLTFVFFSSCNSNSYKKITIETEVEIHVEQFKNERGAGIINNKYVISSSAPLLYDNTYPKWIKEENPPILTSKDYQFTPSINDIQVPYEFIKNKNELFFYVVKFKDTLKFKLINF